MGNTTLANPAPLGLMGFGMTTILLNLHNTGLFEMDVIILAMGLFYGGIAQILAGLLEYKKGNTFGLTAFTSYGSFWLTLVAILLLPKWDWLPPPMAISSALIWHCGASSRCFCSLARCGPRRCCSLCLPA
ncbi:succinate-acetate transporter protein [Pantoea dispersa]